MRRGRRPRNPVLLTQPPKWSRTYRKLGWTLAEAQAFPAAVLVRWPGVGVTLCR